VVEPVVSSPTGHQVKAGVGVANEAGRSPLTAAELEFLSGARLGRLATSDASGQPHVVPVGWRYNSELQVFEISGRAFAGTRKYRNVLANPKAALVIDDVLPPWRPRCVHVQGPAEAVPADPAAGREAFIRLTPTKVTSWGLDEDHT
jgi:pyridoxamine 5'-phosphate oxidase family protein